MKQTALMIITLFLTTTWCFAESSADSMTIVKDSSSVSHKSEMVKDSAKSENKESDQTTLSSDLSGLDSLGITDDTLITSRNGGTQTISLERQVFHREQPFVYDDGGRRDPFRALIVDERKEGEVETDLLRLEDATLTGVVWSQGNYLAMLKDKDGESFFLREGDAVYSGRVISVTPSQAVFEVIDFGDFDRVTLKVEIKKEKKSHESSQTAHG